MISHSETKILLRWFKKKKQSITDENKNKIKDRLKKYNPTRLVKQQWPYKTKQN